MPHNVYLIRGDFFEDLDCFVEVIDYFLLRDIVLIAVSFKSANTRAMLVPLMLPQVIVIASEIFPVVAHVLEKVTTARVDQDQRNVAIFPSRVAELIESAVTMIWPVKLS